MKRIAPFCIFLTQTLIFYRLLKHSPQLTMVKVRKSGHHLSHDRVSKGYGSISCLTSKTSLHACLQRLNTMQISLWHQTRNRPMPLTSSVVWPMMTRFRNFYNVKKSRLSLKRRSAFQTGAKIYLSKKVFGVMGTLSSSMLMIMLVFVNYARFSKKCRNHTSTFYFKFGKNTSITMQQTSKFQRRLPHCFSYAHGGLSLWKESWVTSCETQVPWMWQ